MSHRKLTKTIATLAAALGLVAALAGPASAATKTGSSTPTIPSQPSGSTTSGSGSTTGTYEDQQTPPHARYVNHGPAPGSGATEQYCEQMVNTANSYVDEGYSETDPDRAIADYGLAEAYVNVAVGNGCIVGDSGR